MFRSAWLGRRGTVAIAIVLLASGAAAAQDAGALPDLDLACRLSAEASALPWGSGGVSIEAGLGVGDVALVVFGELPALPYLDVTCGASLGVVKEWLLLVASADFDVTYGLFEATLGAFGAPPSWVLCTADPIVELGASFEASVASGNRATLTLSPSLAATTARFDDVVLGATLGARLAPTSTASLVEDSWIELFADLWTFRVTARTAFDAFLGIFVRQTIAVELYALDLSVSATLEPATDGGFTVGLGAGFTFGDSSILAVRETTGNGSSCSGGVCYGP